MQSNKINLQVQFCYFFVAFVWEVSPCAWILWNYELAFASELDSLVSACGMAAWGKYRTLAMAYLSRISKIELKHEVCMPAL